MNVKWLREELARLNDDAEVLIWINGVTFEISGMGTENHDAERLPRIVLLPGPGYRYRAGS